MKRTYGQFNVANGLVALACTVSLGGEPDAMIKAVAELVPPPGRFEIVAPPSSRHVFSEPGGIVALKTGFTAEAGYNLAVAARHRGRPVLPVVLGASTRASSFADARRLLQHRPTRARA